MRSELANEMHGGIFEEWYPFEALPGMGIHLYGPVAIISSEALYAFPQPMLIPSIARAMTDGRL